MTGLLEQTEWEGRIYSGGWTEGSGGRLEVSDKATDEVLAVVGAASPADVRRAAEVARDAQPEWALTPGKERAGVLRRAAALLGERAEEVTSWIVRETEPVLTCRGRSCLRDSECGGVDRIEHGTAGDEYSAR